MKKTLAVFLFALVLFGTMNYAMTQWHPESWTNLHTGFWTAFKRHFMLSGFDPNTYIVVSKWRPLYELYRHPLLAVMLWPLAWVNGVVSQWTDTNCAIYTVAVAWTLIDAATFTLLYRLLRTVAAHAVALLLCLFYYSFAHVMLAAIAPDHMLLTQLVLILTLYTAYRQQKGMRWWQALTLYFIGMGVSLTNGIKIWLTDMVGRKPRRMLLRSLLYIIPTAGMGALYCYQLQTTEQEEHAFQERQHNKRMSTDSVFRQNAHNDSIRSAHELHNQLSESHYMQWTDNSVDRLPLLCENIFGEGLLLHRRHLLEDVNVTRNPRPVFVSYEHWWEYALVGAVVLLFVFAVLVSWRERLLWLAMPMFLFDMLLHVGLRFAATDAYIMTAHWAFIIPIALALLIKKAGPALRGLLTITLLIITIALWLRNAGLIFSYLS